MGKSKNGGTRSFIRGRVGADVYSVGRDAKGKKQQIVRSLAESVNNPQTIAQMRGRMIMATVMQAVAALRPIVDHSFDNVTGRQPNISEFVSRNYALVKADVAAHPSSNNKFGLNLYGEKGAKQGAYVISDGKAMVPAALTIAQATAVVTIALPSGQLKGSGLKTALGLSSEEYFTLVGLTADGRALYERFRIAPSLSDNTAISASNVADAFATEGNSKATLAMSGNNITITLTDIANCCAVIVTRKSGDGFIHSAATLGAGSAFTANASVALPTYPVGSQSFLNGGDIPGLSESESNSSNQHTPEPTPGGGNENQG